jgi:hypothetical protein
MTAATEQAGDTQPSHDALLAVRKLTGRWIAIGWCSFAVVMTVAWLLVPRLEPIAAPLDRLLLALQLTAGPGVVLLLILQGLWRMQDTLEAEADTLAGKESRRFKINQRVMSNTIEQALIFVPIYVAFAVRMDPEQVFWLPLLMGTWCLARLMFWLGYRLAPHYRAPGMDWTAGTALVTVVLLVMTFF